MNDYSLGWLPLAVLQGPAAPYGSNSTSNDPTPRAACSDEKSSLIRFAEACMSLQALQRLKLVGDS